MGLMFISTHKDCGSRHNACIGQVRLDFTTERDRAQAPIPQQEAVCNWSMLTKGKLPFSNSMSLVYQPHLRVDPLPRSSQPTQNKLSGIFVDFFCFVWAIFLFYWSFACLLCWYFCLFSFLSLLLFYFSERKRAYITGWVGKWGTFVRGETRLKYIIWWS